MEDIRLGRFLAALALVLVAGGCNSDRSSSAPKADADAGAASAEVPHGTAPKTVALTATTMVVGFAGGVLRDQAQMPSFRITKHPITRAQYAKCVEAGACAPSKQLACTTWALETLQGRRIDLEDSPQTCVTVKEATSYCSHVGGRLPRLSEWMLAARGSAPKRYAWGDEAPSCDQHPRASDVAGRFLTDDAAMEAGCVPAREGQLLVAKYADGAAASGMQDVLLTPGELLATERKAHVAACDKSYAGCLVYGTTPGAIDAAYPLGADAARNEATRSPQLFGFRCAFEEK